MQLRTFCMCVMLLMLVAQMIPFGIPIIGGAGITGVCVSVLTKAVPT